MTDQPQLLIMRPSEVEIPVFYPNGDPVAGGAGMDQGDYDHGEVGADDFRTIAELLGMATFNRLDPEFQRCYIGLCVAAKLEAGLILGIGTGWRDWDRQLANHLANPKQFAHPMYSLHMNRGERDVAWAIDSVPYDALGFAHANCGRFHIRYLDHIANERHHCQPNRLPAGGSQFTDAYADLAAQRRDIPYLRMMSLAEWLERDAPIYLDGRPEAPPEPPDPDPEEDDMAVYLAYSDTRKNQDGSPNPNGKLQLWRGDKVECYSLGDPGVKGTDAEAIVARDFTAPRMAGVYRNPLDGTVIDHFQKIPTLTPNQIRLDLGTPRTALS